MKTYKEAIENVNDEEFERIMSSEFYKDRYNDYLESGGETLSSAGKVEKRRAHQFAFTGAYNRLINDQGVYENNKTKINIKAKLVRESLKEESHSLRNAVRKRAERMKDAQEKGEPVRDLTKRHNPSFSSTTKLRDAMRKKTQRIREEAETPMAMSQRVLDEISAKYPNAKSISDLPEDVQVKVRIHQGNLDQQLSLKNNRRKKTQRIRDRSRDAQEKEGKVKRRIGDPKSVNEDIQNKEQLRAEKEEILNWMNTTPHPSQFRIWDDRAEYLSKLWTEKENRLKEINKKI